YSDPVASDWGNRRRTQPSRYRRPMNPAFQLNRRNFLKCSACGVTANAFGLYPKLLLVAVLNDGHSLAPKPAHFEPKAKQLLFVFLTGGFSHFDTFDPKPKLRAEHSKP